MTKFWQWNDPKTKFSLALGSFYFRTTRNEKRPLSRERQEHSRNDPHCSGNEDQTVTKEVRTIHDLPSFRFSFLSFGPRSSFESHSESFGKERVLRNDAGTRSERGVFLCLLLMHVKQLILNSNPQTENNAGSLISMRVKEFPKRKTD